MSPYRFAVLGDPIEHSLSPQIHRAAMESLGMEGRYDRVRADVKILADHMRLIRQGAVSGINVTMPLKEVASRMVDAKSSDAESAGSVNTVSLSDGILLGDSTDAGAMRRLLVEKWGREDPLYILGSGGAAAALAMAAGGRVVYIASRNPQRAHDLADRLAERGGDASVVPWGVPVAGAILANATPLGMMGEALPGGIIDVASGLIDLSYGVRATPAMSRANRIGLSTVDGIEFLVAQAADSFRVWTGVDPPVAVMLEAARQALSDRNT